jgi:membrane protein YdbS with pleckstrin-like domain
MSGEVEPSVLRAGSDAAAAEHLLDDGEIVILAVKPSPWFVVLSCWPVLLLAAALAGVGLLGGGTLRIAEPWGDALVLTAVVIVSVRIIVACVQWLGRLYVLTNARSLTVQGLWRPSAAFLPHRQVRRVELVAGVGERGLGLGTLLFEGAETGPPALTWVNLAHPDDVRHAVEEAVRRRP